MSGNVNTRVTSTSAQILQGSGKITIDGLDVGGYEGGVKFSMNQSEVFVESDWQMGSVDSEIKTVKAQIQTNLEEATLEHIAIAYGIHSSSVTSATSSKVLNLTPSSSMRQVQIVFEGMSATDRTKIRTFTLTKCVKIGATDITLNRGIKTVVPMTFECLMTAGSFGTIVDSTITA
jgi:hypothetical protein